MASGATAVIDTASVDTHEEQRDADLRSANFLEVEKYPSMTVTSTSVQPSVGGDYDVEGNLTVRDVTRPVNLHVVLLGVTKDPWGGTRMGFEASTEFSRKDCVMVGDKVKVEIEVEAVLQAQDQPQP